MATDTKLIAFAIYPGVSPLDLMGPLTVLRDLKVGSPYRTVVVGDRIEPVPTDTALRILPAATFAEVSAPFGVIVPGGGEATLEAMKNESLVAWVRSAALGAEVVGSTGNGALVLAAAGLLKGRRAATHWAYAQVLEGLGATYVRDMWLEDGKFLTAAGGTAGLDAMLHLTARLKGKSRARLAQLALEYDPQPPFAIDRHLGDDTVAAILRGNAGTEQPSGGPK
jgi:transcriptional regulator GlxA family with amidase domain